VVLFLTVTTCSCVCSTNIVTILNVTVLHYVGIVDKGKLKITAVTVH